MEPTTTSLSKLEADMDRMGMPKARFKQDPKPKFPLTDSLWIPKRLELLEVDVSEEAARASLDSPGKWVVLRFDPSDRGLDIVSDVPPALPSFCKLAEAKPKQILSFARRFGPLDLCGHWIPVTHNPYAYESVDWCESIGDEPLWIWEKYAAAFKASLAIATRLHQSKKGCRADWEAVHWALAHEKRPTDWIPGGGGLFEGSRGPVEWQRLVLAKIIDQWLRIGDVRPTFSWNDKTTGIEIRLAGQLLFGRLARELALAVARVDSLATCHNCGHLFVPKRKPRADQKSWCPDCKKSGKHWRHYKGI